MTQTYADVRRVQGRPRPGQRTLMDALEKGQQSTIDALEAQSIPVAETPLGGAFRAAGAGTSAPRLGRVTVQTCGMMEHDPSAARCHA